MNSIARLLAAAGAAVVSCGAFAGAYEIGEEMASESFWKSDPVLFVRRHADSGFEFTSEQREGAARDDQEPAPVIFAQICDRQRVILCDHAVGTIVQLVIQMTQTDQLLVKIDDRVTVL